MSYEKQVKVKKKKKRQFWEWLCMNCRCLGEIY